MFRVAGLSFEHMHMGDNLRMVLEHPDAEIVGVCDEDRSRMGGTVEVLGIPPERVFTDFDRCVRETRPDLLILCPSTGSHLEWVRRLAPYSIPVMMEKPFAASLAEADEMVRLMEEAGALLAINWPLAWYTPHVTAHRLVGEGVLGDVLNVNYYDGNRGPLWHLADKKETTPGFVAAEKSRSWFYKRASGGGSLLDYLGYGTTLGTWFLGGRLPIEVTSVVDQPAGLEVDEHSITIARYDTGLARFETRWGTFTDPWTHQPQPRCGFVIVGTKGTLSCYDYEDTVQVQTRDHPEVCVIPADTPQPPHQNPVQYVLHVLETGGALEGPLSPTLSRIGQQIVDAAVESARRGCTVPLPS